MSDGDKTKIITSPYYAYGVMYLSENFHAYEAGKGPEYAAYRKAWSERPAKMDAGEFPLNMNFEVTTRCNLACTFCSQPSLTKDQLGDLSWDTFKRVAEECGRHKAPTANFNGLGEPLLVKKLPDMIRYAKQHGFIDIMFHTNGTIMTDAIAEALIDAGTDKVIFSVDSPDRETYNAMRVKSDFDRVQKNVKHFHEVRQRRGGKKPLIRTTMVMTDDTHHQVKSFVEMWRPYADQITLQDLTWRTKQLEDGTWANREDTAVPVDFDEIRTESVKRGYTFSCPYLFQSTYTFWNSDVIPCSNPNARKFMVMGNADKDSIKDIWNGKPYKDLRQMHREGKWHEHKVCRDCEVPLIELYKKMRQDGVPLGGKQTEELVVASDMAPADGSAADMAIKSMGASAHNGAGIEVGAGASESPKGS